MPGYPDNFTVARYDDAQGRDDAPDDRAEIAHIEATLTLLQHVADALRGIEASDNILNLACWEAGATADGLVARINRHIP